MDFLCFIIHCMTPIFYHTRSHLPPWRSLTNSTDLEKARHLPTNPHNPTALTHRLTKPHVDHPPITTSNITYALVLTCKGRDPPSSVELTGIRRLSLIRCKQYFSYWTDCQWVDLATDSQLDLAGSKNVWSGWIHELLSFTKYRSRSRSPLVFSKRTFPPADISPWTFPWWIFAPADISRVGHFPRRTISPTVFITNK